MFIMELNKCSLQSNLFVSGKRKRPSKFLARSTDSRVVQSNYLNFINFVHFRTVTSLCSVVPVFCLDNLYNYRTYLCEAQRC